MSTRIGLPATFARHQGLITRWSRDHGAHLPVCTDFTVAAAEIGCTRIHYNPRGTDATVAITFTWRNLLTRPDETLASLSDQGFWANPARKADALELLGLAGMMRVGK